MANPVVTNLIHGRATIYYAPVGESLPADSTAYGTAWGGNWARVGYTQAATTLAYEDEQAMIGVQEALTPVAAYKTAESVVIETMLAEMEADYINLAAGAGTVTNTAAGAGQVAKEEYVNGGESILDTYAWGIEGRYLDSSGNAFPVRFFVYKGVPKFNGALEFDKEADAATGIPIQVTALADTSKAAGQQLYKFQRVTAAASS